MFSRAPMDRVIAAAVLFQCAHGVLQALTPLRLNEEGVPILVIGWVAAAHGLGFAVGCLATPGLLAIMRVKDAVVLLAAIAAAASVALTLAAPLPGWLLLRVATGFATAGLYTVCDAWIGTEPDRTKRSHALSRYMVLTKIAAIVAPMGILLLSVTQPPILLAIAALFALSALPVLLVDERRSSLARQHYAHPLSLLRLAPTACIGAMSAGLLNGSIYALAPVFLSASMIDTAHIAIVLSVFQTGGILSQVVARNCLAGRDGISVIHILYMAVAAISAVSLGLSGIMNFALAAVLFLLLGAVSLLIYPVALGSMFDQAPPSKLIPAAGAMLLWMAVGNLAGPIICGHVMHYAGASGVMVYLAAAGGLLLLASSLTAGRGHNA